MPTLPDGLTIGTRYTQEEIEDLFDTGFGYQISGINPRRPSDGERYVLLFANEDGPYSDAVTEGTFEYVGEGLQGDQSEKSSGNSTLIDAVDEDFSIHFFYQHSDASGWEYQGLVDVLDWEWRVQKGREILVFTMAHRRSEHDVTWVDAVRAELDRYRSETGSRRVTLNELYDFSEETLATQFPENNSVRAKLRQQLQVLRDRGEVEFVDGAGEYRLIDEEKDEEREQLQTKWDSPPMLTEDNDSFTEHRRRVRDTVFAELVKENYDDTCVVCGRSRETPTGNPEVEAAHIYPRSENGADDPRNGVTLCKLHHWAFDSGWLSVTDEYELLVKDAPEHEGYYEFKQLEGDELVFPENVNLLPDPLYLDAHRRLHGF
ncbi:putative restriction endonuclease [Halogranum rubrum]|uniref:Putative restriction endonuclease n=1 Tax=Halogranum rubrum TaxID=553466 RepID=A0A1I4ESN4_9EURY|nr:HNH endonuclease [Halogranum rubrum]SFL08319.1 putative restriction endonuclease [Halogranum rubrum]